MNHHIKQTMAAGLLAVSLVGCATMSSSNKSSTISKADFGKTPDGTPVEIYTLKNSKGAEACIMTYGGIVQKLLMPDKNGNFADIVNGFAAGLMEAARYTNAHEAETIPLVASFSGQDPVQLARGLRSTTAESVTMAELQAPLDFAYKWGIITQRFDLSGLLAPSMQISRR